MALALTHYMAIIYYKMIDSWDKMGTYDDTLGFKKTEYTHNGTLT